MGVFNNFVKDFQWLFNVMYNGYLFLFVCFMGEKSKIIFTDPLFYLIILDCILTLIIVYYGFGVEVNPIVKNFGFFVSLLVSFFLYFCLKVPVLFPKNNDWYPIFLDEYKFLYLVYLCYYIYLNIHHFFILLGY